MAKKTAITISSTAFLFLSLLFAVNANAQNIPPGQEPAAGASRFQDEAERRKAAVQSKGVKAPEIEMEEKAVSAPEVSGVTFVLKEVRITGMTLFKPEEFTPAYRKYIDKEVTFKDINDIADIVRSKYKAKGYLTTNIYVPEQEIAGGVVEIKVVEGRMGNLMIEGNKWFTKNIIAKYFHAKKNEILNIKTFQRDILRLNQNPDLQVRAVIGPGKEPQTSDITLKVEDKFPYHVGAGTDDMGTRLTGKYRTSVSARSSNLTGNNEFVFFNAVVSRYSAGQFVTCDIPIDTYGTKFGFDCSYFTSKIGREFKDYDIVGNTLNFIPHMTGEIYLSERLQITADLGLNIKSVKKYNHADITNDDELRMPFYRMDITYMDTLFGGGQTTFSPEIIFGTRDFLGASPRDNMKTSRISNGGYFFKYDHNIRRIQRMPWESYAVMRSQFQATTHSLPSSEQFQIGGMNTVRGYPEGDYLSDIGASLSTDWIFPMYLIPKEYKLPYAKAPLRNQIQPVVFFDMGGGYITDKLTYEKGYKFLMGVGGGLRINLYDKFSARIEFAQAIGATPTANSGPSTFHLSVNFEV